MSYLTESERNKIEAYLDAGLTQREIARRLGRHYNTIYNEIKRGTIRRKNSDWSESDVYDAYRGQAVQKERGHHKGRGLNIGNDIQLADYLENKILNEKYSPYAALVAASLIQDVPFCLRTLYGYIHKNLFYNLSGKHLKKCKKQENEEKRVAYNNRTARLIDERPVVINNREEFGHWEMDTVVSGRGDNACLLVLTERMTRLELIRRIDDKSQQSVCKVLDEIEKTTCGSFRSLFRSITCDNGSEFLKMDALEKSVYTDKQRTTIYYCHPYRAGERGSNENQNRLIRYWCPKGCHLSDYDDDYIANVEYWLNHYPRKIFDGKCAADMARLYYMQLF